MSDFNFQMHNQAHETANQMQQQAHHEFQQQLHTEQMNEQQRQAHHQHTMQQQFFSGFGGSVRPSKLQSLITIPVAAGLMVFVISSFGKTFVPGQSGFPFGWIFVAVTGGMLMSSLYNLFSKRGASLIEFKVNADTGDAHTKLRQLEKLRQDGLISKAEYDTKRADVLKNM